MEQTVSGPQRNTPSKYEVVLETTGGRRLVGFTARRTREGLVAATEPHLEALAAALGLTAENDPPAKITRLAGSWCWAWTFSGGTIRFSGRTERDAQQAPYPQVAR
jgi:hypothetical protein